MGGDHRTDAYGAINPQRVVPTLVDGTHTISQSQAIIEYLEETQPQPSLLPEDAVGRARVRALARIFHEGEGWRVCGCGWV